MEYIDWWKRIVCTTKPVVKTFVLFRKKVPFLIIAAESDNAYNIHWVRNTIESLSDSNQKWEDDWWKYFELIADAFLTGTFFVQCHSIFCLSSISKSWSSVVACALCSYDRWPGVDMIIFIKFHFSSKNAVCILNESCFTIMLFTAHSRKKTFFFPKNSKL